MSIEQFETLGLVLGVGALYLFIVMAIWDVLKKSKAPRFGKFFVWLVLFLSPAVFVAKLVVEYFLAE
ncbi:MULTISPECIES: DUF2788 domain-containing protein [Rheinheimera]|uniref:DUF2788 domain-containing protein n=1 Tax=Rheinheimera marina TaxID=1774958 RepID=A0ABV9JHV8_9GAMM